MAKTIDLKDLIPMPSDRIEIGGTAFYMEDDGNFSSVTFMEAEMNNPARRDMFERETKVRRNWGRMFLSRRKPWGREL